MILPAQTIHLLCLASQPMISPFHKRTIVNGMSFGLSAAGYDIRIAERHIFGDFTMDGRFALGSSVEQFAMPDDVLGVVHDKSTWARRGLMVQNTVIEPGWRGFLTLELTYSGKETLFIKDGDPIAQIVFHRLEGSTMQPYTGKYQDQRAGPVPAIEEKP